jgi:hypothetical protein
MPAYSGKFQYTDQHGAILNQGSCQLSFDRETCVVTPAGGTPLVFDLGDVDRSAPGDWELQLALYTGCTLTLRQFGTAFSNMSGELVAAWRDRTVQCLLLEDLEEAGRYQGAANGAPGEIRIFKSNLAFLPQAGLPVQWRLAEVESIVFDDSSYSILLTRGQDRLVLSKLARKTDEVLATLQEVHATLREHSAAALHSAFPFLSVDQLVRLQLLMPEGRSASLAAMNRIHPMLADSMIARAVTESLRPYFAALRSRAPKEPLMAGFKLIRHDEEEEEGGEQAEPSGNEERQPLFFWFFLPLSDQMVAWEATTGAGRATYFFRGGSAAIDSLTRGLALINFRREPVYLPDDSLDSHPRYHRYSIGARKLPDLRALRAAYVGRAIHSTVEAWQAQVDSLLASK